MSYARCVSARERLLLKRWIQRDYMRIIVLIAGAVTFIASFWLTTLIMDQTGGSALGPNVRLIRTLPAIIDEPGEYALGGNLDAARLPQQPPDVGFQVPAITIVADNVRLRGNGYTLTNTAGLQNRGIGIYALNRSNVTIEQMTIRGNGFWYPIQLQDDRGRSGKNIIRQNRLTGTFRGARVEGDDNTIVLNEFIDIGGQTSAPTGNSIGLEAFGNRSTIRDNRINSVQSVTNVISIGVAMANCAGSVLAGNTIANVDPPSGIGVSVGDKCHQVVIEKNQVLRWHQCIAALDGKNPDSPGASGRMTANELKCNTPQPAYQAWKVDTPTQ
jgi:hypothetical protein